MEEYDAEAVATTLSEGAILEWVSGLDRAQLMEVLNLESDWPLVADIKGTHPASSAAPNTLRIHAKDCPFLEVGASAECCTGSVLCRSGHSTLSMPCYRTDLLADSTLCAHCDELWAAPDQNGFYKLDPVKMAKAAEVYKPGKTGVMRKWQEIEGASSIFEDEVGSAKDIFEGSTDELDSSFPGMDFNGFCKEVLNKSGVVFADAGRAKNPYRRTFEQQKRIGMYAQRMAVLWVRVKSAVKPEIFAKFMKELRAIATRVENAARWTIQGIFKDYPVFAGPIVCADIMAASGVSLCGEEV